MYRVDRNNFYRERKCSTVYTPPKVSRFLFELLRRKVSRAGVVLDPCVGAGSLLAPFRDAGFRTQGIDIEDQGYPGTLVRDFISINRDEIPKPSLVIANPPFNIDERTKVLVARVFAGRPLLPELWLHKIVELWGMEIPVVLFAPYGLRLNQNIDSRRWRMFVDGNYPEISSIVSLPKNIYDNVTFHSEILIFNVYGLKGHYFYDG